MNQKLLVSLAVILFLPNLFNVDLFSENGYNFKEEYDASLSYINNQDMLNQHVDSLLARKKISTGTYDCVYEIARVIRKRFYHGYSHFTFGENWIAVISGKLIDSGLCSKVQPDEILKHQNAACSQQSIVMMSLLRKRGIPYRHIGFPHHYAMDVLIEGKWYFFDPNKEPNMNKDQRSEDHWQYRSDSLKQYYKSSGIAEMDYVFGVGLTAQKGSINEIPAPNARLFQATTGVLSKTLWCFPLLFMFFRPGRYFRFKKIK